MSIAGMARTEGGRRDTDYRQWRGEINSPLARCPCSGLFQKQNAPAMSRGAAIQSRWSASAAIAEQAQHEQEQVDEVEIERQGAHDSLAADDGPVLHRVVHLLDLLGV